MKTIRTLSLLFLILQASQAMGQHTERFNNLTQDLKARKSVSFQNFYADGTLKNEGTSIAYKMREYTYHKTSGTYQTYYKSGELKSTSELDNYGNVLEAIFYNLDGSTWWKSKTLKIDSNLFHYKDYFKRSDHLLISNAIKEYKFSDEIGGMYLHAEGTTMNGSKQGTWRFYNEEGRLEEEVSFD